MSDSEDGQNGVPLLENLSSSPEAQPSGKRKRDADGVPEPQSKRAAKRKKTKKPKDIQDEALDVEAGLNHAMAHMDSRLMADHIAQRTKRFLPDLSAVELGDRYLPEKAIVDTSRWETSRSLDNLPAFLEHFSKGDGKTKRMKLTRAPEAKGSPHTFIIASAGLRAADLTRALRKFQTKEAMVAKLFAKHIKLRDAVEMVKKTRMNIGVGTPQRLSDLLEDGSLSASALERIIIDASHIDQKKRGILDMKETMVPLLQLLTREELKNSYQPEGKVKLLFY